MLCPPGDTRDPTSAFDSDHDRVAPFRRARPGGASLRSETEWHEVISLALGSRSYTRASCRGRTALRLAERARLHALRRFDRSRPSASHEVTRTSARGRPTLGRRDRRQVSSAAGVCSRRLVPSRENRGANASKLSRRVCVEREPARRRAHRLRTFRSIRTTRPESSWAFVAIRGRATLPAESP